MGARRHERCASLVLAGEAPAIATTSAALRVKLAARSYSAESRLDPGEHIVVNPRKTVEPPVSWLIDVLQGDSEGSLSVPTAIAFTTERLRAGAVRGRG